MAKNTIVQDEAAAQARIATEAARIAKMWDEAAAQRYIANEKRKLAWLARHGYSEIRRSHVCFRWLVHRRCLGWRCPLPNGNALEHSFAFLDRKGERVIICAPYPNDFSMEVVTAACATWGLTADIRNEDTFYGYGTIQIEFRKAQQ